MLLQGTPPGSAPILKSRLIFGNHVGCPCQDDDVLCCVWVDPRCRKSLVHGEFLDHKPAVDMWSAYLAKFKVSMLKGSDSKASAVVKRKS